MVRKIIQDELSPGTSELGDFAFCRWLGRYKNVSKLRYQVKSCMTACKQRRANLVVEDSESAAPQAGLIIM